jgi:glutamyl-tRNA reductase
LSDHIYPDLSRVNALLIGAGEMIELVARHLSEKKVKRMVIANRTLHRARELAENFSADAILLSEIPDQLVHADFVVTCTGSQLPILGKGAVERALKLRRHRPILIVDIAVPRDVEPEVGELNDVYLYTVDDLQQMIEGNVRAREAEAAKADELINESLLHWQEQLKSQDAVDMVKELRQWADNIRHDEMAKAQKALERGERPEAVIDLLSRSMMNKLIHSPSVALRQAGAEGRQSKLGWARELFGLSQQPSTTKDENNP